MKAKITLVSIGHIDHGKSTLVGRLLYEAQNQSCIANQFAVQKGGVNFSHFLDALEEERERGITIDTVHTPFEGNKYRFEIIDCPGHKEFIKNMMGGATHASAAQLLISAAPGEGIQEQTCRHLWLARLFGIKQIVAIINKMDLVNYSEQAFLSLRNEAAHLLSDLGYQENRTAFVPTSGKQGENVFFRSGKMPWWQRGSYLEVLEDFTKPARPLSSYPMRFSVQSCQPDGLIVGRVGSGILKVRDALRLEPAGGDFRVLEIRGNNERQARAGESVGLKLKGNTAKIERGSVLLPRVEESTSTRNFKAKFYIMDEGGLNEKETYNLRAGLQESPCSVSPVSLINPIKQREAQEIKTHLPQHMAVLAEITCQSPVFVESFSKNPPVGRLLLEKEGQIIAAGIVA